MLRLKKKIYDKNTQNNELRWKQLKYNIEITKMQERFIA